MADEGQQEEKGQPNEEELRAQLEDEIRKVKVHDVLVQSVVSILNLAARRIAKEDERDLEQGRLGIEAAKAVAPLLEPEAQKQVEQAVSELQMLYAKQAGGDGEPDSGEEPQREKGKGTSEGEKQDDVGGKGDSGLWTPGS
jgi:hypothetical protein